MLAPPSPMVGWHLPTVKTQVHPRILERASIACSMTGGLMGALWCGLGREI